MTPAERLLSHVRGLREAAANAVRFVGTTPLDAFVANELLNYATCRALEIIGEAAKNVPAEVRSRYADIPWKNMAALRDRIIHGYLNVNLAIIWGIVVNDLPTIIPRIQDMISELEADSEP